MTKHEYSHEAALEYSRKHRNMKVGVQRQTTTQRTPCPVTGCSGLIQRVDVHLKNVHKMEPGTAEFNKYVFFICQNNNFFLFFLDLAVSC